MSVYNGTWRMLIKVVQLERIGRADKGDRSKSGVKAGDALINANFVPYFLESKGNATLAMVADQIDYIGNKAGRR